HNHGEDLERLKRDRILIDGEGVDKDHHEGKLLQIFTETVIGAIFFEIVQRKGNQGFGEGTFRALFESIEADQIARGVIGRRWTIASPPAGSSISPASAGSGRPGGSGALY